jgi:hypothetical protein
MPGEGSGARVGVEAELTFDSLAETGVRSGKVDPSDGDLRLEQLSGTTQLEISELGSFDTIVEGVGPSSSGSRLTTS